MYIQVSEYIVYDLSYINLDETGFMAQHFFSS